MDADGRLATISHGQKHARQATECLRRQSREKYVVKTREADLVLHGQPLRAFAHIQHEAVPVSDDQACWGSLCGADTQDLEMSLDIGLGKGLAGGHGGCVGRFAAGEGLMGEVSWVWGVWWGIQATCLCWDRRG